MTACRVQAAPPLPRAIREGLVTLRPDGSALVIVAADQTVECPACHRAAAFVVVRARSWACLDCDG